MKTCFDHMLPPHACMLPLLRGSRPYVTFRRGFERRERGGGFPRASAQASEAKMECIDVRGSGEFLLIARRNNSLSATGRALVVGSLIFVSLAISLAFAFFGAWLVLPFAGVEIAVVCLAFRHMQRHAADFESLAIKGDRVLVERWDRGRMSRYELNRYWAQVVLHRGNAPGHSVLALRSHGHEVEFGLHLTEEQKQAVARTLKQQLPNR